MRSVGVIGGGASGMMAAIAAAELGANVTILEKKDRPGKKILATGNGKCNLSNRDFCVSRDYRSHDMDFVSACFARFSQGDTEAFFWKRGLLFYERDGYLYPRSQQAATVAELFYSELEKYSVKAVCNCAIQKILPEQSGFTVQTEAETLRFDRLILAAGSAAGTKPSERLGGFEMARRLGLSGYEPIPALGALCCRETYGKLWSGVRCKARITLHIGKKSYTEEGEVQLTDYGISGIPVFQCSRYAAIALQKGGAVTAGLDFLPEIPKARLAGLVRSQYEACLGKPVLLLANGLVHKKIAQALFPLCGLKPDDKVSPKTQKRIAVLFEKMKELPLEITAARPMETAQVCAGGIALSQVDDNLQAKKIPGLYLCGELLDVDGRCGGYNLQWAWTSGHIAGEAAAHP